MPTLMGHANPLAILLRYFSCQVLLVHGNDACHDHPQDLQVGVQSGFSRGSVGVHERQHFVFFSTKKVVQPPELCPLNSWLATTNHVSTSTANARDS